VSVMVGALLGLTTIASNDSGALTVQYATAATGYYPAAWTTFSGAAVNWASGDRDVGVVSAAISARYWRFSILPTSMLNITVGRVWLGTLATYDLGGIHSPGGISAPRQNRIEQVMEDGSFNINALGFPGRDFSFPFNITTSAVRDQMHAIAAASGSVVLVDAEDDVYEVLITGGAAPTQRSNSLYSVSLEARRLP